MKEKRNAYRLLVGRPEGRSPLRRPKCKLDAGEIRWCGIAWIDLAQDRNQLRALVNIMNICQEFLM
jgi:hypothetical protein